MLGHGQQIGHYKILSAIGAGGMGEVFLAVDSRLNRKVALKVLSKNIAADKDRLRRFKQEAFAASALNHPNILTVHEFGVENGVHFLATELIEGETLREKINGGELSLTEVLTIAEQTAFALSAAHAAGIVHRDLKPENIMIRRDGIVKVLDFGLAKLIEKKEFSPDAETAAGSLLKTEPGVVMGTVPYMSPEQATGKDPDARTDAWSLGVVLYEMMSGKLPFAGETIYEVIVSILKSEPPLLSHYVSDVPSELEKIVGKCLRKNRDERYQNVKDLQIDLKDLRQDLEFEAKLERSSTPNKRLNTLDENQQTRISETDNASNANEAVISTTDGIAYRSSSAEYVAREIKQHKGGVLAALMIVVLLGVGFGYWFYARRSTSTDSKEINSIAILPFENGSGDASLDYLSDGLSESLIDKLSQLPQLKVIARNSSFKYRGANIDVQDVANKLGVQAIVMGKVIRVGDNLTMRVEMIDTNENRQLWSEQYNRKASDILAIQQEIAQTASEKLRLKLSGAQEQQLEKRETVNPQAYELVLKGNFYVNKGGTNAKKALEYYQQAIAIDPNYALAYTQLSASYRFLAASGMVDPKEILPKAEAAVRRALELDENLADAHLVMANFYRDSWEWAAAEAEYKRALELNPNLGRAHRGYSNYLGSIGRHDEAIVEAKRARELDPLALFTNNASVGLRLFYARRYDEAIEVLQKTLELDPNYDLAYVLLGYTYAGKGMYREAITAYQNAIRLGDETSSTQIYLGASYAQMGERGKAQAILKQLQSSKEYVSPSELAVLYGALGDKEAAFQSLEKGYTEHDLQLQFLKSDPAFDSLRDDPRFQDLLRRIGFPQ